MGKALLIFSNADSGSATGRWGYSPGGGSLGNLYTSGNEALAQTTARLAGTLSKFAVLADATGTGRSAKVRKNTADGSQVVSPTDTTAGVYEDAVNTDSVASGDLFALGFTSTGTPLYRWCRLLFTAALNHACWYISAGASLISAAASTTYFELPVGGTRLIANAATEANVKLKIRTAGSLQKAVCKVNTARATDSTLRSRINGANGNIAVTLTGAGTGYFEDVSNTDALVSGNDFNWAVTTGTGTDTLSIVSIACVIINTTTSANDIFSGDLTGIARAASATTSYYLISGKLIVSTTEANRQIRHGFPVTTSNLRMYLSANSYSVDGSAGLNKNGVAGGQAITLTAAATGFFEDATHNDTFATTDDASIFFTGGSTGSITIEWMGLTEMDITSRNRGFIFG